MRVHLVVAVSPASRVCGGLGGREASVILQAGLTCIAMRCWHVRYSPVSPMFVFLPLCLRLCIRLAAPPLLRCQPHRVRSRQCPRSSCQAAIVVSLPSAAAAGVVSWRRAYVVSSSPPAVVLPVPPHPSRCRPSALHPLAPPSQPSAPYVPPCPPPVPLGSSHPSASLYRRPHGPSQCTRFCATSDAPPPGR